MAAESLNLSKLAWVLFIWLCLDPPLQRFRGGFQCGLAATPQSWNPPQAVLQVLDIVSQLNTLG